MKHWVRLGQIVTWLTVAVCAAAPTLAAVGALTWFVTIADDAAMRRLAAAVDLPLLSLLALVTLALGPWWALAWALLMRDRAAAEAA